MKKLVLMLAVAFSMSFFACGNKEQAAEVEATEEAPVEVVEEAAAVVDTCANAECCDSAAVVEVAAEAVEAAAPAAE